MKKKLGYTALAALMMSSSPLMAMTDDEINARFKQYEARIKALEADLANKPAPVYEQNLGKTTGPVSTQSASDNKLKINGFMTAAVSMADDTIGTAYEIQDNPNFRGDSKAGLQFDYNLGSNSSAVMQLVARSRGGEPWKVDAEWAYINYGVSDNVQARMGRLRIPLYMTSETLDVGYTYPWVRPPLELYQTAITSYEGADMLIKYSTGDIQHTLQPFVGSSTGHHDTNVPYGYYGIPGLPGANATIQLNFKDIYGVTLNSTFGNWSTKLTAMHMGIDGSLNAIDNSFIVGNILAGGPLFPNVGAGGQIAEISDELQYYAVGGMYDNGSLLAMAEFSTIRVAKGTLFGDSFSGQGTLGYRIDRWTPYATYAWAQSINDADFTLTPRSMKSITMGLRRELTDQLSAKLEWNNYFDLENNGSIGAGSDTFTGSLGGDVNVYTFALDAVF